MGEGRARKQVVEKHVIVEGRKSFDQSNNNLLGRVQQTDRLVLNGDGFSPTALREGNAQRAKIVRVSIARTHTRNPRGIGFPLTTVVSFERPVKRTIASSMVIWLPGVTKAREAREI
jgi:hypothetical protein